MIDLIQDLPDVGFALKPIGMLLYCRHDTGLAFGKKGITQNIVFDNQYIQDTGETLYFEALDTEGVNNGITFTFKDLVETENDMPTRHYIYPPSVALDFESYINGLVERSNDNFMFSFYFKSTYRFLGAGEDNGVPWMKAVWLVEARDNVASFTVSKSAAVPCYTEPQSPALPDTTPINYRVLYEVYGHANQTLFTGFNYPNTEGYVRLNFADVLKNFIFSKVITPPNMVDMRPHIAPSKYPYHIRYAEESGSPVVRLPWAWRHKEVIRADVAGEPYAHVMPNGRWIGINDPEYLAWHNNTGQTLQLALEIKTTIRATGLVVREVVTATQVQVYDYEADSYENGSYSQSTSIVFSATVRPNQTVMIPVLKYHTTSDVAYLELRPLDASTLQPLGDFRGYYIDPYFYPEVRHLAFLNHFGVWETVRMTGNTGLSSDVKRLEASSYRNNNVLTETYLAQFERNFMFRSGWINQAESFGLEHLMSSLFVCEILPGSGYIPLRLTDSKYTPDDGKKESYSWEINAKPTQRQDAPNQNIMLTW
jgi:hypothetical protein